MWQVTWITSTSFSARRGEVARFCNREDETKRRGNLHVQLVVVKICVFLRVALNVVFVLSVWLKLGSKRCRVC